MFKLVTIFGLATVFHLGDAVCSCPSKSLSVFVSGTKSLKVTTWSAELVEKYTVMVNGIAKIQVSANVATTLPNTTLPDMDSFLRVCTAQAISSQASGLADKNLKLALQLVQSLAASINATASDEKALQVSIQNATTALVNLVNQLLAKVSASVTGLLESAGGILVSSAASLETAAESLSKNATATTGSVATILSSLVAAKLNFDMELVKLVFGLSQNVLSNWKPAAVKIANDLQMLIKSDCGPGVEDMIENLAAEIKAALKTASSADLAIIGDIYNKIVAVLDEAMNNEFIEDLLGAGVKLSIGDICKKLENQADYNAAIAIIAKLSVGVKV